MPRVKICVTERYPYYLIYDTWDLGADEIELTDEELKQVKDAELQYSRAQQLLAAKIKELNK